MQTEEKVMITMAASVVTMAGIFVATGIQELRRSSKREKVYNSVNLTGNITSGKEGDEIRSFYIKREEQDGVLSIIGIPDSDKVGKKLKAILGNNHGGDIRGCLKLIKRIIEDNTQQAVGYLGGSVSGVYGYLD